MAGLINNLHKFVALCNRSCDRQVLRHTEFDGHCITVAMEDTIGGVVVTTRRAPKCTKQDQRLQACIDTGNTILFTKVERTFKQHAYAVAAVPKATYGNLWSFPTKALLAKARAGALRILWGGRRAMRCPEVVLALLTNCVRVDPQSAAVFKALSDTRRIISKCDRRYTRFYRSLYAATKTIEVSKGQRTVSSTCASSADANVT